MQVLELLDRCVEGGKKSIDSSANAAVFIPCMSHHSEWDDRSRWRMTSKEGLYMLCHRRPVGPFL